MILIGQYDSPFVRRVGIALTLYGIGFEHRPLSAFGDADELRRFNPLTRVPTLVLDDGGTILDSVSIIDFLDRLVGPDRAMFPTTEPDRRRAMRVATLALGVCDKAVALFYEKRLHATVSATFVARCEAQIAASVALLDHESANQAGDFWFGTRIGHEDIAVACMLRFVGDAHPGLIERTAIPALSKRAARLETLPAFRTISQAFVAPA